MGFFSDDSQSNSSSYSGLRMPWSDTAYKSVVDMVPQNLDFAFNRIKKAIDTPVNFKLNAQGFLPEQMEGVNVFGRNLFNNVSSNYASRGLLSPDNVNGVVGSAVREAAPSLMGMVGQNVRDSILIPEQIQQNRFTPLLQTLGTIPGMLGSYNTSSSSSEGRNILSNWADPNSYANLINSVGNLGKGGGGSAPMFCWIAEAIYGANDLRTHLARWYVNTILPLSEAGRAFRAWYGEYGQRVAELVLVSPKLRALFRPVFDQFVRNALIVGA